MWPLISPLSRLFLALSNQLTASVRPSTSPADGLSSHPSPGQEGASPPRLHRSAAAHGGLQDDLNVTSWHLISSDWNELHAHAGNVWLSIFLNTFHDIDFKSSTIVSLWIVWLSRSFRGPRTHTVKINCFWLADFPWKTGKTPIRGGEIVWMWCELKRATFVDCEKFPTYVCVESKSPLHLGSKSPLMILHPKQIRSHDFLRKVCRCVRNKQNQNTFCNILSERADTWRKRWTDWETKRLLLLFMSNLFKPLSLWKSPW